MQPINHLSPQWQKLIREIVSAAPKLEFADIVIKVTNKQPAITEYTIKRKAENIDNLVVTGLFGD